MKERIYVWKSQVGVEKIILQPQVVSKDNVSLYFISSFGIDKDINNI